MVFEGEAFGIGMPPDGAGIPQGGKISALVWNVFFAVLYTAGLTKRVQMTFADDDGLVLEYDAIDDELVRALEIVLERVELVALKIGVTFGFSKTQILVVSDDVVPLQILCSKSSSLELRSSEITDKAKWLGCKIKNTVDGLIPESASSLLGKSTSVVSQFTNFCLRYSGSQQLHVRRQVYQTFIVPLMDYTVLTFYSKFSLSDLDKFWEHERRMWDLIYMPGSESYYGDLLELRLVPIQNRYLSRLEVMKRHFERYARDPRVSHAVCSQSILGRVRDLSIDTISENQSFCENLKKMWQRFTKKRKAEGTVSLVRAEGVYESEFESLPQWLAAVYVPYCPVQRERFLERMVRLRRSMSKRTFV